MAVACKLTDAVGAAELCGDDVLHVAMETKEDLNGVNLHLQSAGQVHHLKRTHRFTSLQHHSAKRALVAARALPCAPAVEN